MRVGPNTPFWLLAGGFSLNLAMGPTMRDDDMSTIRTKRRIGTALPGAAGAAAAIGAVTQRHKGGAAGAKLAAEVLAGTAFGIWTGKRLGNPAVLSVHDSIGLKSRDPEERADALDSARRKLEKVQERRRFW